MATIAEFFVFTLNYTWRYYTKDEHLNYKQHKGLDSALLTCAIDIRRAPRDPKWSLSCTFEAIRYLTLMCE